MPLALVLAVVDVVFIIHAAKTGRFNPWAYVILLLPGIGALAYIAVELLPAWFDSVQGQQARRRLARTFNPQERYRDLADQLALADTIANRVAVAEECLALGKFEEARRHFAAVLAQPLGDEPIYMIGRARAEFGLGDFPAAVATLDDLKAHWPEYQSADGHLLYARALEDCGRTEEALHEYEALSQYFPGAAARVRYGLLLDRLGRQGEAKAIFHAVLTRLKRASKYVRKVQAEWIAIAERELGS
jgi:hypothetical protein